jgi:hypothetical protein
MSSLSQETCQGFNCSFLRRTEALRLIFGPIESNSHSTVATRAIERHAFLPGVVRSVFGLDLVDRVAGVAQIRHFPASVWNLPKVGRIFSKDI